MNLVRWMLSRDPLRLNGIFGPSRECTNHWYVHHVAPPIEGLGISIDWNRRPTKEMESAWGAAEIVTPWLQSYRHTMVLSTGQHFFLGSLRQDLRSFVADFERTNIPNCVQIFGDFAIADTATPEQIEMLRHQGGGELFLIRDNPEAYGYDVEVAA